MFIKECQIQAFGRISDLRLRDLDSPLVALVGPNEAGKSTLFEFFKTMIFGIYPVSAENNRFRPWNGRALEGSLTVRLADGQELSVHRRLRSAPEGHLENGDRKVLRNQTIPPVHHVSRELYDSVYSLRLRDLSAVRDKPWEEIQDRLLGSHDFDGLRPVHSVLTALGEEAGLLWRTSHRGRPQAKLLETQIHELRKEARSAAARDESARNLDEKVKTLEQRLAAQEEQRLQIRQRVLELERLVPIGQALHRISELRREVGDTAELGRFPESPAESLEALDSLVEQQTRREQDLKRRIDQACSQIEAYESNQKRWMNRAPEIRAWLTRLSSNTDLVDRLKELKASHLASETSFEQMVQGKLVFTPAKDQQLRAIEDLPLAEVRAQIELYSTFRTNSQHLKELERMSRFGRSSSRTSPTLLGLASVLTLITSRMLSDSVLLILSILLGCGSALWYWWSGRKQHETRKELRREIDGAESKLREAKDRIKQLLQNLGFPQARLDNPDGYLASDVQDLKATLEKFRQTEQALARLRQEREDQNISFRRWLADLSADVGEPLAPEPIAETAVRLEERLMEAERQRALAEESRRREIDLRAELTSQQEEKTATRANRDTLRENLAAFGGGDPTSGILLLDHRRKALATLRRLEEALETDYPDWRDVLRRYHGRTDQQAAWSEELSASRIRLEELIEQNRSAAEDIAAQRRDLAHLKTFRSESDLKGEIAYLQEKLDDVRFRRDRLALLEVIVRRGEASFREKHQPDVFRRASQFLNQITAGRYHRLDSPDRSGSLEVYLADRAIPVDSSLSQGTRDQIYLSLRLGLAEHLDNEFESLPLFFDEIFVNWDEKRRGDGYQVLSTITSDRQAFIFTCHQWFAEELKERVAARIVELSME